ELPQALDIEADDNAQNDTGYRAGNANGSARHQEYAHHRATGCAHSPQDRDIVPLVLHQHDKAGNDVQRSNKNDKRQDHEHDIAFDFQRREECLIALAPVDKRELTSRGLFHRCAHRIHLVRIIDKDFKRLHLAFLIEEELRLGQRHHDNGRVIFRHADLEDRHNRISFHTWIDAKWRDIAIRRNHPQRIADGKAEIFRHTGADGNTATLVKTFQRTLTDIAGNKLELVEVFFTQAAHESAGSSAD